MNAGEIKNISFKPLIEWANTLFASDEFERAIDCLTDKLPAYYRDNPPQEVLDLVRHAYHQWMSIGDYAINPHDEVFNIERSLQSLNGTLRGTMVKDHVKKYNEDGITPHIVDMGPGEFWLPLALKELGLKFTYYGYCLQKKQENRVREHLGSMWQDSTPDKNVIFNACEIIEHITKPEYDILQLFNRMCPNAETVYISTPLYTYGGGNWDWHKPENKGLLGHLRAYTPREFSVKCGQMFPGYVLSFVPNEIMMIKGTIKSKE